MTSADVDIIYDPREEAYNVSSDLSALRLSVGEISGYVSELALSVGTVSSEVSRICSEISSDISSKF